MGRRKRQPRMVVRVLPPGQIKQNRLNPYRDETASERREGMIRTLVEGLSSIVLEPAVSTEQQGSRITREGT